MKQQGMRLLGLLAGCCFGLQAQSPELTAHYPDSYTVRQGDTLWDISARFLTSPWLWPRLWQANPRLTNPHLIYPGDVLTLIRVDGQPRLVRVEPGGTGVARLSPRVRAEPAVATIPLASILNFTDSHRILAPSALRQAPYILGDQQGRVAMVKGDDVYVRGRLHPGEPYAVYRLQEKLTDRMTDTVLGQKAVLVGTVLARQQMGRELSRVAVSSLRQEMRQGDKVLPLASDGALAAFYYPRPGPAFDNAYVVAMGRDGSMAGRHGVVFINKGRAQGVRAGDLYAVLKPGPGVYDYGASVRNELIYADSASRYLRNTGQAQALPSTAIARLMVFSVQELVSTALILDSEDLVRIHYRLGDVRDAGYRP
ncbi:LysM peptidoglycan-binding domain-containing protein [Zobellella sp. DQSA1]|uniref:LysM peptidoglycan-binding domain-containing protein n=1 Tax=Zobellella sp. DQSA1 TaxID=3342386 RepID=UPI0035BF00A4